MTRYHRYLCLAILIGMPAFAQAASSEWKVNPNGQVQLIAADNRVPRQGKLALGFHFKTAPGWYVYWKVPGDAGYPPSLKWDDSQGMTHPRFFWPAPTKFILPGSIIEYGYEGDVVYPVEAELTPKGDSVHVSATLSYLTCNTACVPYKYTFVLDLPVGSRDVDVPSKELIERFSALVPSPEKSDEAIQRSAPAVVKALLPISQAAPKQNPLALSTLIVLAFFGGLLLNVMPCVLPVLSIKLLGLVKQSGHARSAIVQNTLLSAAGIITSFVILGSVAVFAKAGGRAVGWGIQFQNPGFVLLLAVIVFLFALNLWGVFEIGMPRLFGHFAVTYGQGETPAAHFVSGLFVTLLATPCSAPFLGTAMGFALTQTSGTILMAFATAGIGMALPYLLLAIFPSSLNWLPKPGVWMIKLKMFFGILLAGTTLWLLWVFLQEVRPTPQEPFDESRIETLIAEGKPVLVDVTADWCVTCKYNERLILGSSEVRRRLEQKNVVILKADWTNRNETIRQYLARYGRSGIPFYAYYAPGKDPVTLSEFLTKEQVLDVLNK